MRRRSSSSKVTSSRNPASARRSPCVGDSAHGPRGSASARPVFGWIKHVLGFRRFSLRGLAQVTGEWSLVCLAVNGFTSILLDPGRWGADAPDLGGGGGLEIRIRSAVSGASVGRRPRCGRFRGRRQGPSRIPPGTGRVACGFPSGPRCICPSVTTMPLVPRRLKANGLR